MVTAKFRCQSIIDTKVQGDHGTRQVVFNAVYGNKGENADYSKATPWGELRMNIDKDTKAFEAFQPGKNYYLTFEEAPE